jgi:hypothetical protein
LVSARRVQFDELSRAVRMKSASRDQSRACWIDRDPGDEQVGDAETLIGVTRPVDPVIDSVT